MELKYFITTFSDSKSTHHSGSIDVDVTWKSSQDFLKNVYPIIYKRLREIPELSYNNWVGVRFEDKFGKI